MTFTLSPARITQALRELNDLTHVDTSEYTEDEHNYRGELLSNLFSEFQQADLRVAYDRQNQSWYILQEKEGGDA